MKKQSQLFYQKLQTSKQLALIPHTNGDGDSMGASCALSLCLEQLGVNHKIICPDALTNYLLAIPNAETALVFQNTPELAEKWISESDMIVFLDHNQANRTGGLEAILSKSRAYKVMIDHHLAPQLEVDLSFSYPEMAATCCILYQMFQELPISLTKDMATALFTGILTDTGNFKHGTSMSDTMRIAADLLDLGVERESIIESVYHNFSFSRMQLIGFALNEKLKQVAGTEAVYIALTEEELIKYHFQKGDTADLVNLPLAIKNVKVSALLTTKNEGVKFSFRSKGEFDVNLLAATYFNGGGHKNASGAYMKATMEEAILCYEKAVRETTEKMTKNNVYE